MSQNVRSILGQQAGARNSRVLKGPNLGTDPEFERQVENAEASRAITEDESDELLLLDLIVAGIHRETRDRVYVGVKVPITANDDDVNRAADKGGNTPEDNRWAGHASGHRRQRGGTAEGTSGPEGSFDSASPGISRGVDLRIGTEPEGWRIGNP